MPDAKRSRVDRRQGEIPEGTEEEKPPEMQGARVEHAEGEDPDVSEA